MKDKKYIIISIKNKWSRKFLHKCRKYTKELFDYIILENIKKAEHIETHKISKTIMKSYNNINEIHLLEKINHLLRNENLIPILNTSLFFICEYNINLINEEA